MSAVVFDGQTILDQGRSWSPGQCSSTDCVATLTRMRMLAVTEVNFHGTLTASPNSPATSNVQAYVPITAVAFNDGLTIPFAGWSANVLLDHGGELKPVTVDSVSDSK